MKQFKLYSIKDLAKKHNLNEETVRRWAREGKVEGFKVNRDWMFYSLEVPTFIRKPKQKKVLLDKT